MFTLSIKNKYGQIIELTHNPAYTIKSIVGLDPPDAVINTTKNANTDGSVYNSSYVGDRTITITLVVNESAEKNRIALYQYVKTKMQARVLYQNGERDVYIDGYVQKMNVEYFAKKQIVQITILCPEPYFLQLDETVAPISSVTGLFTFPFSIETPIAFGEIEIGGETDIYNIGDIETGAVIVMEAKGVVEQPKLINIDTGDYFQLDMTLQQGDIVMVNTVPKRKKVNLNREGIEYNLIGSMKPGSTWLKFLPGSNLLTATAQSGLINLRAHITVYACYEGV